MGKNVDVVTEGGGTLPYSEEEAKALGATVQDPSVREAASGASERRRMFDTTANKLNSFSEAVVNATFGGFLHGTGEEADLRRDVNSGSTLLGDLVGTGFGLVTGGPVKSMTHLGEGIGKAAATGLLRQSEKSIATRALMEAGAGSLLATSHALGQATLDTVIEDRPFAGEAVLHAAKLGGIMGGAGGGLIGLLGKVATKGEVLAGAGVAGTLEDAMAAQETGRAAYGEALHFHEVQLGAIKELRKAGKLSEVSDDFIRVRSDAVRAARRAQAGLKELDVEAALSGKDPGAYKEAQRRWAEYTRAMDDLDGVMGMHEAERAGMAKAEYDGQDPTGMRQRTGATERVDPTAPSERTREGLTDMVEPTGPGPRGDLTDMDVPLTEPVTPDMMMDTRRQFRDFEGHADTAAAQRALDERMPMRPEGVPLSQVEQTANLRRTTEAVQETMGRDVGRGPMGPYWGPEYSPMRVGEDAIGLNGGLPGNTGPFQQYQPFNAAGRDLMKGGTQPMERMPFAELHETGPFEVPGARRGPSGQTGPFEQPGYNQTGPFERVRPGMPELLGKEEAALNDAAGNVQGKRAKMFRDASRTQPGVPKDMTQPVSDDMLFSGDATAPMERPTSEFQRGKGIKADLPDREDVTRQLLADWEVHSTARPWDAAKARTQQAMGELYVGTGGRMDSARALGILEKDGIKPSADLIGQHMDSVYAMNRAARMVGAEVTGGGSPLRDMALKALGNKLTRAVLGNALGGPAGALLGWSRAGGKLAAASGRLAQNIANATEKFMTSTKVRLATVASTNQPWSYSERGPIKDPIERIQEIQFLASNPDGIRTQVRKMAGPAYLMMPQVMQALEDKAIGQVQTLALRAPAIYFDKLGRALSPPQSKMRNFFEFENGVNDLENLLQSLSTGSMTPAQADALKAWPSAHEKVCAGLMADPEKLQGFTREQLRQVEMVTGAQLTPSSDPMFVVRQQAAWQPPNPVAPPAKAQAYNINPDGAPTPSQAPASGRAPGN